MHTFPAIKIKTTNFESTTELFDVLEKRLQALEKLLPADETHFVCEVELERLGDQHSGRIFRAEVNLTVGGDLLRAEATRESMEDAIDRMRDGLKRELRRRSGKRESLFRRGAQRVKNLVRFGREG